MKHASRRLRPTHRHIRLHAITAAYGTALLQMSLPALGQTLQNQPAVNTPSEAHQALGLPAIIVHAQKQDEDILTVPASISVVDGLTLEEEGAQSLETLTSMVSGLSFQHMGQSGLTPPSSAA